MTTHVDPLRLDDALDDAPERLWRAARALSSATEGMTVTRPFERELAELRGAVLTEDLRRLRVGDEPMPTLDEPMACNRRHVPDLHVPYGVRQVVKLVAASTLTLPAAIAFEIGRGLVQRRRG